jgi:lantibiotic modifying enzyme
VRELARRSKVMGHGVEWSATTDVIAGGAGIGLFLLAFHQATGDQDALSLATRAGRRLEQLAVRERVGRSWRMDPEFPRVMPNFAHGTAGIAFFLARLAAIGGERRFLEAARDGADHLLSIADQGGGGLRVHHHTPGGEELHYLGWCHGPPGTERLFAELARQTGEARYSDAARALTRTLLDAGLPAPSAGFWNNLGQCCGTAGVIEHLIDVAARTDEDAFGEECFALAQRLGDDLLARGEWKDGALRFMQAEHRTRPAELAAQCGYMQGAAGIGLALMHLEAAAAARGRNRRTRSDAHAVRLPDALPWPTAGGR